MDITPSQTQLVVDHFESFVARSSRHGSHQVNRHLMLLVAELIGTAEIRFFDWSPDETRAEGRKMAGQVVVILEQELLFLEYSNVDFYVDEASTSDSAGSTDLYIYALESVRSISTTYREIHRERHGLAPAAFLLSGDGWQITFPELSASPRPSQATG